MCSVNIANVFVFDRDPKDAKYVDLAISTKADFLVTRDKDLLDLREKGSPLLQIFEKLDWQFKIVLKRLRLTVLQPYAMISFTTLAGRLLVMICSCPL